MAQTLEYLGNGQLVDFLKLEVLEDSRIELGKPSQGPLALGQLELLAQLPLLDLALEPLQLSDGRLARVRAAILLVGREEDSRV